MDSVLGFIFNIFAWLWLFVVIGFFVISFLFIKDFFKSLTYFRKKHLELWRGLGGWKALLVYPLTRPQRTIRYIWNEEYKNIGDEKLNVVAGAAVKRYKLFIIYSAAAILLFIGFLLFWIIVMYFASTKFRP